MEINDYILTATEKEAARMERPLEKKWLTRLWWVALIVVTLLGGRVFYVTVARGAFYREIAKGNSVRSVVIKAPRGRIFDRSGVLLVENIPSLDVVALPMDLPPDVAARESLARELAAILSLNEAELIAQLQKMDLRSLNTELIKENITQEQSLIILEKATLLPGIKIEKTAIREYIDGPIFSHVLGYEGKIEKRELEQNQGYLLTDYIGKQGLEKSYEKYLRGVHGATQVEVDSMGSPKREVGVIESKPGGDLFLSIDAGLQKKIYDSLSAVLEKTQTRVAAAVAINPRTGKVLALVNLPSFDNNLFARKISQTDYQNLIQDEARPLFNRALAGEYPPGSTIKPALACGALAENVINSATIIDGLGGRLTIGNFSFGDWKVHGPSDVRRAIAESNDIFFYTIGGGYGNIGGLGIERMKKYYNLFGFGEPTGIDLGGEAEGFIPNEQWKLDKLGERWYVGNSYHASIGQGYVTATPLQLANYTAAIANGGTLFKPSLVEMVKRSNGEEVKIKTEKIRSNFVDSQILRIVQEGMRLTVTDGTAQLLKDLPVAVAGKTGTAQFSASKDTTHAWFVSYAPFDNPQIAMAVLVEGVGNEYSGAVPATKEVYQWYFSGRN